MAKRLTNEIIDERLIQQERTIIRIGDIVRAAVPIEWKCLICNHNWFANPSAVTSNTQCGCPKCGNTLKKTNEEVDKLISNKNVKRLEEYKGNHISILWQCLKCNNVWKTALTCIMVAPDDNETNGCPVCARKIYGKRRSLNKFKEVEKILKDKNLTLLSPFTKVKDKHEILCNVCNYKGFRTLISIVTNDRGCPSCSHKLSLTNEYIDLHLQETNPTMKRIGEYVDTLTKIEWKCLLCNNIWSAKPANILYKNCGCSRCRSLGMLSGIYFNKHPERKTVNGLLYLVEGHDGHNQFLKIGITEKTVIHRFDDDYKKLKIKEICIKPMMLYDAFTIEQTVLKIFAKLFYVPKIKFDGITECFKYSQDIINYFQNL